MSGANKEKKSSRKRTRPDDSAIPAEKKKKVDLVVYESTSEKKKPQKSGKSGLTTRCDDVTVTTKPSSDRDTRGPIRCEECGDVKRHKTDLKNCLFRHNQAKILSRKNLATDKAKMSIPRGFQNHSEKSLNLLKRAVANRGEELDKDARKRFSRELFPSTSKVMKTASNRLNPDSATLMDYIEACEDNSPELEQVKSKIRILAGRSAYIFDNFRDLNKSRIIEALKDLLELKENGKLSNEQFGIVTISALMNALTSLSSEKKAREQYRNKWINAQRLQAETQKLASNMEHDMLETLRANVEAMRVTEMENDKLSVQKSEVLARYEELTRMFNLQSENIESLLCKQVEPSCSYDVTEANATETCEEINIEEQDYLEALEPVVECVEEFTYEEGIPMSVYYDQMNHDEPDSTGKFPKSKKKKGSKKTKSTNNNEQSTNPKRRQSDVNTNGLNIDHETALRLLETDDSDE